MGIDFDPKVQNGIYENRFEEELRQDASQQQTTVTVPIGNTDNKSLVDPAGNVTPISGVDLEITGDNQSDFAQQKYANYPHADQIKTDTVEDDAESTASGSEADGSTDEATQTNPFSKKYTDKSVIKAEKQKVRQQFQEHGSESDKLVIEEDKSKRKAFNKGKKEVYKSEYDRLRDSGLTRRAAKEKARKAADEQKGFMLSSKKAADIYVDNEVILERAAMTRSEYGKDEVKDFDKKKDDFEDAQYKQYRADGQTRKQAHKQAELDADNQFGYMNRLNKDGRKFVSSEENRGLFFDKDGKYKSDPAEAFAGACADYHSTEGEVRNGTYSLKEQRDVEHDTGIKRKYTTAIAKAEGYDVEKDCTNAIRVGVVTTALGAGVGIGIACSTSVAAVAADAVAGAAAAGSGAAAVNLAGAGAAVGGAVGTTIASMTEDKGRKDVKVFAPGQPQPVEQPPVEQPQQPVTQPVEQPPVEQPQQPVTQPVEQSPVEQPCDVLVWDGDYCDYNYKKGENWFNIAKSKYSYNDKKLTGAEALVVAHGLKRAHGVHDYTLNTMPTRVNEETGEKENIIRLHTNFDNIVEQYADKEPALKYLEGKEFTVDCDGKVIKGNGNGVGKTPYTPFNGYYTRQHFKQDCHDPVPVATTTIE